MNPPTQSAFRFAHLARWTFIGAISLSASAFGNLLTNGSFEDPSTVGTGNFQVFTQGSWIGPVGTGWLVTDIPLSYGAPYVLHDNYVDGGVAWPVPSDGSQFLYLGNSTAAGTAIQQTLSLSAGTPYELAFDLADFQAGPPTWVGHGPGEVLVDVLDSSSSSLLGGPQHFSTAAFASFTTFNLAFTPSATGDYSIRFTSLDSRPANLDKIQLNSRSVPDTGTTLGLLALGIAAAPAARRLLERRGA